MRNKSIHNLNTLSIKIILFYQSSLSNIYNSIHFMAFMFLKYYFFNYF